MTSTSNKARHSTDELEALRKFSSPTIANALETFGTIPNNEGFMNSDIKAILPGEGAMVGYAVTAKVAADQPPSAARPAVAPRDYWQYVYDQAGPKIVVHQDIDAKPIGAMWGEVNVNVHRALGCLGTITSGGVRDVPEASHYDFRFFASCVLVSHAYAHYVDYGGLVRVGGLTVKPGDLLHADLHGVVTIPVFIDPYDLVRRCEKIEALEREIFALAQSPDFSVDKLDALWKNVVSRWPAKQSVEGQNL